MYWRLNQEFYSFQKIQNNNLATTNKKKCLFFYIEIICLQKKGTILLTVKKDLLNIQRISNLK